MINLLIEHTMVNLKNHGRLSSIFNGAVHYGCFAKHPMQSEDRLYNPKIDFPIGIVFGDSDWLGSEGSDEIVQKSCRFESGES